MYTNWRCTHIDVGVVELTRSSDFTGDVNSMVLPVTQGMLDRYYMGNENVQDVFPTLNADQREFIMTGCTPEEWEYLCEHRG
tara:strand:+ start:55 stop:300 length:246 start_codon:yes stop_codon:yes gene_type:complete